MKPIPDNFESVLNALQLMTLRNIEQSGWELYFIRRDGLDIPVPVVRSADGETIGVIEVDGRLNTTSNIRVRLNPELRAIP
jgi:hypothetical protein